MQLTFKRTLSILHMAIPRDLIWPNRLNLCNPMRIACHLRIPRRTAILLHMGTLLLPLQHRDSGLP